MRLPLGRPVDGCQMTMVRTAEWKYVHHEGLRPQLFDLLADPDELHDLGGDPRLATVRAQMAARLFDWLRRRKTLCTIAPEDIESWNRREVEAGILIGRW